MAKKSRDFELEEERRGVGGACGLAGAVINAEKRRQEEVAEHDI